MNETIDKIKQLRLQLDGLGQLAHNLRPIKEIKHVGFKIKDEAGNYHARFLGNSPEITRAKTDIFFAKGWCGQLLSCLGQATPYKKDGHRKEVKDIEPADDHVSEFEDRASYEEKNHIQKVDYLRQVLGVHKKQVLEWSNSPATFVINQQASLCVQQIWIRLTDARMDLGFELQRIYEEAEKDKLK